MSAKATNGPAKPSKADAGVLASLPTTRPNRLGGRSRDGAAKPAGPGVRKTAPKPRATAAKSKQTASGTTVPKATTTGTKRPQAVRAGSPKLAAPNASRPKPSRAEQGGTELVGTVVQAAGELAQIGLTVGSQILRRAVEKFPRP